jgi:hypothetical protein
LDPALDAVPLEYLLFAAAAAGATGPAGAFVVLAFYFGAYLAPDYLNAIADWVDSHPYQDPQIE